jgi:acyl dehydratase
LDCTAATSASALPITWPSTFPQFIGEVFVSFRELSCTFLAEVHSGDTLYPALTVTGLEPNGDDGIVVTAVTVRNQRGQLVLSGQHKYLLRRQRAVQNGDG